MPLIRPRTHRIRVLRHISRLQEPNREALLAYARFIGESPDYVLNQLIESTLPKDRDFIAWRAEHPDAGATSPADSQTDVTDEGRSSRRTR